MLIPCQEQKPDERSDLPKMPIDFKPKKLKGIKLKSKLKESDNQLKQLNRVVLYPLFPNTYVDQNSTH